MVQRMKRYDTPLSNKVPVSHRASFADVASLIGKGQTLADLELDTIPLPELKAFWHRLGKHLYAVKRRPVYNDVRPNLVDWAMNDD